VRYKQNIFCIKELKIIFFKLGTWAKQALVIVARGYDNRRFAQLYVCKYLKINSKKDWIKW
jgi:hypothetical protein